jgi:hypothetical protein
MLSTQVDEWQDVDPRDLLDVALVPLGDGMCQSCRREKREGRYRQKEEKEQSEVQYMRTFVTSVERQILKRYLILC